MYELVQLETKVSSVLEFSRRFSQSISMKPPIRSAASNLVELFRARGDFARPPRPWRLPGWWWGCGMAIVPRDFILASGARNSAIELALVRRTPPHTTISLCTRQQKYPWPLRPSEKTAVWRCQCRSRRGGAPAAVPMARNRCLVVHIDPSHRKTPPPTLHALWEPLPPFPPPPGGISAREVPQALAHDPPV